MCIHASTIITCKELSSFLEITEEEEEEEEKEEEEAVFPPVVNKGCCHCKFSDISLQAQWCILLLEKQ